MLGTEFNVLAYAEDSVWETSLLKGAVEIQLSDPSAGVLKLEPNTMGKPERYQAGERTY